MNFHVISVVSSSPVVIVVVVMRLKNLLSELLLTLVNVCIKFVPVLSNGKLLIIVNWDIDLFSADRFIIRVMELSYIWML